MRVFLDTNILISAILNPFGAPAKAYERAVSSPCSAVLCEQNLHELRSVFTRKFPTKLEVLE